MSSWQNIGTISNRSYTCGYCDKLVGPNEAYYTPRALKTIYICPNCDRPTFFDLVGKQTPSPLLGRSVNGITDTGVAGLYNEIRNCTGVGAYTSAVMSCRKILMHVAVEKGADQNLSFVSYVDYLVTNGWVPPGSKQWIDPIRQKGNEANHEISLMDELASKQIVHFTEMLLRFVYELPAMV